jgi:hypothetical protein
MRVIELVRARAPLLQGGLTPMSRPYPHRWLAIGLISILLSAFPSIAAANHSWGGYHWARTSNPFTVQVGDNVSSAWDSYLGTASADWTRSSVLDTRVVTGGRNPRNCRPTSGRDEVCNAKYGNTGWLGVAQIWISGGTHIVQGTVKVNDTYFNTATYNTPAWRALVMCQEIGHTFGLDHQDENFDNLNLGTCMDYTRDPDGPPSNEHPNQHDYDELVTIYTHLDSVTTVGQATRNALDGRDWGQQVRGSRASGSSLFVKSAGRGNAVVTFVIWTR